MNTALLKKSMTLCCLASSIFLLASCGQKYSKGENKTNPTTQTKKSTSKTTTTTSTSSDTITLTTVGSGNTASPQQENQVNIVNTEPEASFTIPQEAIGIWSGQSLQAKDVFIEIQPDGSVSSRANFEWDGKDDIRQASAQITGIKTIAPSTYIITSYTGENDAFLPGITGLGGIGFFQTGFKIDKGNYIPISVGGASQDTINYANYHDFNVSLSPYQGGGEKVTSGLLELDKETPVYAQANKATEAVFVQAKDTSVQWDHYFEANGEFWYSFVQKSDKGDTRYYIAYSDVGH